MGILNSNRRGNLLFFCLITATFILGQACSTVLPVKIGISKASPKYEKWLKRSNSTVKLVNLYALPIDSAIMELSSCDGLLLTGGEDVYPAWYGMEMTNPLSGPLAIEFIRQSTFFHQKVKKIGQNEDV